MPGSWTDLDPKNIIMPSIEELSEEEQRKYAVLQAYIKQQFLVDVEKGRGGKTTRTQEFNMPAIKIVNDKVEVIPNVSEPSPEMIAMNTKLDQVLRNQGDAYNIMDSRFNSINKDKGVDLNLENNSEKSLKDSHGVLQTDLSACHIKDLH